MRDKALAPVLRHVKQRGRGAVTLETKSETVAATAAAAAGLESMTRMWQRSVGESTAVHWSSCHFR